MKYKYNAIDNQIFTRFVIVLNVFLFELLNENCLFLCMMVSTGF